MQRTTAANILVWILADFTVQPTSPITSAVVVALLTGDIRIASEIHREIDINNSLCVDILSYPDSKSSISYTSCSTSQLPFPLSNTEAISAHNCDT